MWLLLVLGSVFFVARTGWWLSLIPLIGSGIFSFLTTPGVHRRQILGLQSRVSGPRAW